MKNERGESKDNDLLLLQPQNLSLSLGFFSALSSGSTEVLKSFVSYTNMPRYYCDYCDTYLTHDSPSVRKQHGQGYKHKSNVRTYYQQFEEQQTQILIDQRIKEHLGKTAVYQQQVGAAYNQHLGSMPGQRPQMSLLPTPQLPMGGNPQLPMNPQMFPGIRPPVLPRPPGAPGGYMYAPTMPPGAPSLPPQLNGPPGSGHPPGSAPPIPGSSATPNYSSAPSMGAPPMYQPNPAAPTSGGGGYDQQH